MSATMMPQMPSLAMKDEGELLYTTLVGMVMAAIFATRLHDDVERTLTHLAPEGSFYPFAAHTRPSAAKFASAVAGFLLGVVCWTLIGAIRWGLVRRLLTYRDWLKHPASLKTKVWGVSLRVLMPRKKYLNAFQHVLPRYPLPKLSDTCNRALEVYEPLLSPEEFDQMSVDMREFEKNEGPMLHAMLEKRYYSEENWVSELWDKYAYLSQRTPIVVNTSIGSQSGMNISDLETSYPVKQAGRAASMAYAYLTFWEMIRSNTLPSILVRNIVPICAARYRYLMSCTRIPGIHVDELKCYEDSKHIIVISKGVMYHLNVYFTAHNGEERILPAEEIQRQLEIIMEDTTGFKEETAQNPAIFTAQNRKLWAGVRERLQMKMINLNNLRDVESAIFHLTLQEESPENLTEEARLNLCTTGYDLWCDKSITLRIYKNSRAGLHFEHSTADATLFGRMLEFVWEYAKYDSHGNAISGGDEPIIMPRHIQPPMRLDWDLSEFEQVIPKCLEDLNKLCDNVEVKVVLLRQGKGAMKTCRVSPDGLVQMALQLAFYRIHGTSPKTYESASARFFEFGRTETIRPVSMASVAFTKAMDDKEISLSKRAQLCKKAIHCQNARKLQAMNGEACDRHIFGLYVAAKMAGLQPKIFQNKHLLSPDQLSTSQSPYCFDAAIAKKIKVYPTGGAFGPQRPDGYGVYYLFLDDDAMTIHVTSFRSCPSTSSSRMSTEIVQAIEDIKNVLNHQK